MAGEGQSLDDLLGGRIFSDDELARVLQALAAAGATKPCPRCGNEDFSLVDGYFVHTIQRDLKSISLGGGHVVPTVVVICTKCGWVAEHAVGALGLLPSGE